MEKGDKFTQQNKNTKPYYWFPHFKVYLCISGGYNYYLQWWTIFRQCQEQTLIQEVKDPMGKEKCSKKTLHSLYPEANGKKASRSGSVWLTYGHQETTTQFLFQPNTETSHCSSPSERGTWEKMLDHWGKASHNLHQWFSVGLSDTCGLWKPHQTVIQCRKTKFWCHLGLLQLVLNTEWFKLGLTDTSACSNSIKYVPLVALCIGIAALHMCRKKENVNHWSISSSKVNTLPPSHYSIAPCSLTGVLFFVFFSWSW